MYLGDKSIHQLYVGDKKVKKVYLGDTLVFPVIIPEPIEPEVTEPVTWTLECYTDYGDGYGEELDESTKEVLYRPTDITTNSIYHFGDRVATWFSVTLPIKANDPVVIIDKSDNSVQNLYAGQTVIYQQDEYVQHKFTRTGSFSMKYVWIFDA